MAEKIVSMGCAPSKTDHAPVAANSDACRPKAASLRIIHFNDVYNVWAADRGDNCGGAARFVALIDSYFEGGSRFSGENPLVLFSGDLFNPSVASTVTLGAHMVPVINKMHVAASVYGNHDFDLGLSNLCLLRDQCNFPWLISNVIDKSTNEPLAGGKITVSLTHGGRKIGLIGLVEQGWMATLATINQDEILFEDPTQCATRLSSKLRAEGCELVIALTHMRVPNDVLLAETVGSGVLDMILGGHDHHYEVRKVPPHDILMCKSGTDFRDLTVVDLQFAASGSSFETTWTRVPVLRSMPEDRRVVDELQSLEVQIQNNMKKVIGRTLSAIDCRFQAIRTSETNASNFVADCVRQGVWPQPDIALINSGTLRTDAVVAAGDYTVGDLMAMLPMLDPLVVLSISGAQLLEALENGVSQWPALEGRWPCVSGIRFSFDSEAVPGKRVDASSVEVGGVALDLAREYTLCTKEYLAQGKDGYGVFQSCAVKQDAEDCPMLATTIRHRFLLLSVLAAFGPKRVSSTVSKAVHMLKKEESEEVASPLAAATTIRPVIDGRIVQLNGKPVVEPLRN